MRSIIATLVPITRANSKIEIPAASASVAKRVAQLVGATPAETPTGDCYVLSDGAAEAFRNSGEGAEWN